MIVLIYSRLERWEKSEGKFRDRLNVEAEKDTQRWEGEGGDENGWPVKYPLGEGLLLVIAMES
jgi:hypothetical protein